MMAALVEAGLGLNCDSWYCFNCNIVLAMSRDFSKLINPSSLILQLPSFRNVNYTEIGMKIRKYIPYISSIIMYLHL